MPTEWCFWLEAGCRPIDKNGPERKASEYLGSNNVDTWVKMDWEDQPRTRTKEKSFLHPLFLVNHLIDSETAECRFIADATRHILQSSVGELRYHDFN